MKEQTKRKISYALMGRRLSALHKERISRAMSGEKKSEEHKRAIAEGVRMAWEHRRARNGK